MRGARLTSWWRQRVGPAPERTEPVTAQRLLAVLAARGYQVRAEPDGAWFGVWDDVPFRLSLGGAGGGLLAVVGSWPRHVPESLRPALSQVVNDWNRDALWPTVLLVEDEDGLTVRTAVVTDLSVGATDAQMAEALETGLAAGVQMLAALTGALPEDEP